MLDSMIAIWKCVFLPFPHFAFGVGRLGSAGYESVQSRQKISQTKPQLTHSTLHSSKYILTTLNCLSFQLQKGVTEIGLSSLWMRVQFQNLWNMGLF